MRRRFLPSISLALWLAFFLGLTFSDWRHLLISADGDPCLHWRIGNWMLEHREILRVDEFSHTRYHAPLVAKEWLGEVIFAGVGNIGGWNGVVLLSALLIATTMWLLHRYLLAAGTELLLATGLTLAAAFACATHWLARPHLFTHLFVLIFVIQLRRGVPTRTLFATLVPLMWLWTNLHGAFFTGFVLVGLDALAAAVDRQWRALRVRTGLLTACVAVSLLNPNGWQLHAQVIGFLKTPLLAQLTTEFRSPNFHLSGTHGLLLLFGIVAGTLLVVRPRWTTADLLLVGVWGYFALHSMRNVPVFALVAVPVLAAQWQEYLAARPLARYRRLSANITGLDRVADGRLPALLVGGLLVVGVLRPDRPLITTAPLPRLFPVNAVERLRAEPGMVTGAVFNAYAWGGYLMLELPERRVFMDGRNDFYGGDLMEEFERVDNVRAGWEDVLAKYRVGWTLLPTNHTLNAMLALDPGWRLVYTDQVAVIYGRR